MVVGQLLPISKAMNAATYATTSHDCLIHILQVRNSERTII
jgi:hypothetical protein